MRETEILNFKKALCGEIDKVLDGLEAPILGVVLKRDEMLSDPVSGSGTTIEFRVSKWPSPDSIDPQVSRMVAYYYRKKFADLWKADLEEIRLNLKKEIGAMIV